MKRRNYLKTALGALGAITFTGTATGSDGNETMSYGYYDEDDPCQTDEKPDDALQVELYEYDSIIYENRGTDITIKVTNPTDEYLTERILLRPHFGRDLMSGEFTVPPNESRTYTAMWYASDAAHHPFNELRVTSDKDCDTAEVTAETPASLRSTHVGQDDVTLGDDIELSISLGNLGTGTAHSRVTVTHHMAGDVEDPTADEHPGQETIHDETYEVPRDAGECNEPRVEDTITYTPEETGNHAFRISNESSEISYTVTVTDE